MANGLYPKPYNRRREQEECMLEVILGDDTCISEFIGFPDDRKGASRWSSIYTIDEADGKKFHRPIFVGNKVVVAVLSKEKNGKKDIYPTDIVSIVYSWEADEIVYLDINGYKKTVRPGKAGTNGVTFITMNSTYIERFLKKDYSVIKSLVVSGEFIADSEPCDKNARKMYPLLNFGGDYLAVVNKDTKQVIDFIALFDMDSGVYRNKLGETICCGEYSNLYGESRDLITGTEVIAPCTVKEVLEGIKDVYPDFVMDIAHMFVIPVGTKEHTFLSR